MAFGSNLILKLFISQVLEWVQLEELTDECKESSIMGLQ